MCKNCNIAFTCGCQKTKASDGATVHKDCLMEYEARLKAQK